MDGHEQLLSDAALACPDWQSFYFGGVAMGVLSTLVVCVMLILWQRARRENL